MKTLAEILYEYDARRNRSEAEARAYMEKAYADQPELKSLKGEFDEVYFTAMRRTLLSPALREQIMNEAQEQAGRLQAEMDELCKNNGIDASRFRPVRLCSLCEDTGYVPENNAKKLCKCVVKRLRTQAYGATEIDELEGSFEKFDINVFKTEEGRQRAGKLKLYAENYCAGRSMLFTLLQGGAGLGKSYLMYCMAKRLNNAGEDVVFIGAFDIFRCFHLNRLGELADLSPIYDARYLFIDDMGSEPFTQNVTREYLFDMIEHRSVKGLKTVISTNLSLNELAARYGEKVASRLCADRFADRLLFEGKDIRIK